MYADGVLAGTNSDTVGALVQSSAMVIGDRIDDLGTLEINADIDSLIIWDRALTASEVAELTADPWGLITPRSRAYFYGAIGGGATAKWRPLSLMGVG